MHGLSDVLPQACFSAKRRLVFDRIMEKRHSSAADAAAAGHAGCEQRHTGIKEGAAAA